MDKYYRDTWSEINLDAIYNNVKNIVNHVGKKMNVYAVVKANGYGHGDIEVAKVALEAGATHLAVAFLDEALKLRQVLKDTPILVMGAIRTSDIELAAKNNISISVHDMEWFKELLDYDKEQIKIHLKIDSGMNRIGFKDNKSTIEFINKLRKNDSIILEGLFTHFSTADNSNDDYFNYQLNNINNLINKINTNAFEIVHIANSATTIHHTDEIMISNGYRLGIAMYGLRPSYDIELPFKLEQAFSLYSKIIQVKKLNKGEKVGYGATYETSNEEYIATIPIGYADGIIRANQGRKVAINAKRYEIVGRVCMDQLMVRVDETVKLGDTVELLGDNITVDEAAHYLDTINYEIVCSISDRVPRIYKYKGKLIEINNYRTK